MPHSSAFLGVGPSEQDPLYGVIDTTRNFFYVVDYRLVMATRMAAVLASFAPVRLLALHECRNWSANLIDNSVCERWGIETDLKSGLLTLVENHAAVRETDLLVMQNLDFVRRIFLTIDARDAENVMQDLPLTRAQVMFAQDAWVQSAAEIETGYHAHARGLWQATKQSLVQILASTDISTRDYERQVKIRLADDQRRSGCPTSIASQLYV
jgi:hypothetical protein